MAILVQDSFTDVDGTLLQNHIPEVGEAWTRVSGGFFEMIISHNKAINESGGFVQYNNLYSETTDQYSEFFINQDSLANFHGLAVRSGFPSTENEITATIMPFLYGPVVRITDSNGLFLETSLLNGVNSLYRLEAIGNIVRLYQNDMLILYGNTTVLDGGRQGFSITNLGIVDNFKAGTLASTPSPPSNLTLTCGI